MKLTKQEKFVLRYDGEMTRKEMAMAFGKSVSWIRNLLGKARVKRDSGKYI
jgi:DNA-directed RNA polymerase specialized sigma24 family protein